MINNKINEIHLFIEGVTSVCDDTSVIAEKTLNYFGKKLKRIVDYVLLMIPLLNVPSNHPSSSTC